MLALLSGPRARLLYAEFGDVLGPPENPHALIRWVVSDYPRRRDDQWRCPAPLGTSILRGLLAGPNPPDVTAACLLALGWYGMSGSAPDLIRFLDDPGPDIRRAALQGLGSLGRTQAVPEIQHKLGDPERRVAREAMIALAKDGRPEALSAAAAAASREPDSATLLAHGARRARALAADDIPAFVDATMESPWYEDLCAWMSFIWQQVAGKLAHRGQPLELRIRAARLFGLGGPGRSARLLLSVVTDPGAPIPLRAPCALALSRLGLPGTADALLPLLDAAEPELQLAIIAAVGGSGAQRALTPLLERWEARGGILREPLRHALRGLGRGRALDALLSGWSPDPGQRISLAVIEGDRWTTTLGGEWVRTQLEHPDPAARADAAAVLGLLGDGGDLAALARKVLDPDERVRWVAAAGARALAGGDVTR